MEKRIKFNKVIKLKRENVTPKQSSRAHGLHIQSYILCIYVKYLYLKNNLSLWVHDLNLSGGE